MPGPLEGIVVVDAAWGAPSAVATMLLADYGATVVKVERPGGGPDRDHVSRSIFDRGKRSVVLDLTAADGVAHLLELLGAADVFFESGRPGEAEASGYGYGAVRETFPTLVYTSISAYGQDTPFRDRPGFDCLVSARMGLMAENAVGSDRPIFLGHPHLVYGTAFMATMSTLAALQARTLTGRGQSIDASLLDAVTAQSPMNWMHNEAGQSYLAKAGEVGFGRNRIVTDIFRASDGEYLMIHTGGDGSFKRAFDLLGLGEKIRRIDGLEMSVPLDDDEYRVARFEVHDTIAAEPRQHWLDLFHSNDLAALPVLRPGEVLDDDQVRFADVEIRLPGPDGRELRQVGPVIAYRDSPAGVPAPAPIPGADQELLGDPSSLRTHERLLGPPDDGQPARLDHPLQGLRVLDFSSFFATAYGAKFMADLGADVIKVETPAGDQMRPIPEPFSASQRGKRMLAVDLKSPAGREVVRDLLRSADVVMHNLRPGKAEKLGFGYDDAATLRPDVIYAYLPGFGSKGPKAHLKSFAPLVSGFTGLLYEGAGEGNEPVRRVLGNEDYNNGFLGVLAVLMALLHRARTGRGQYLEMPQLHSSLFVTTGRAVDAQTNQVVPNFPLDHERLGYGPLYRQYRAADGWLAVACVGDAAFRRLATALALEEPLGGPAFATAASREGSTRDLADILASAFAELPVEKAFSLLEEASVPAEIIAETPFMADFLWVPWAEDAKRVVEGTHHRLGYVREIGLSNHLSETPATLRWPAEELGKHSVEILRELGYDQARIDGLVESRAVVQSPPR